MLIKEPEANAWRRRFALLPTIISPTERAWLRCYEQRHVQWDALGSKLLVERRLAEGAPEVRVIVDCAEFADPERRA